MYCIECGKELGIYEFDKCIFCRESDNMGIIEVYEDFKNGDSLKRYHGLGEWWEVTEDGYGPTKFDLETKKDGNWISITCLKSLEEILTADFTEFTEEEYENITWEDEEYESFTDLMDDCRWH